MRAVFGTNLAAAALASCALVACAESQRDPNDPSSMAAGAPAVRAVAAMSNDPVGGLAGRTFILQAQERGTSELVVDTVTFTDGTITSSMASANGLGPTAYRRVSDNIGESFTAVMTSPGNGQLEWSGMLLRGRIDGRVLWTRPGGEQVEYEFKGLEQ